MAAAFLIRRGFSRWLGDAYDKSAILYGLDTEARRRLAADATPVLLEGAMDVEAVRELADPNLVPVASCGTSVTACQLDELLHPDPGHHGRVRAPRPRPVRVRRPGMDL